MQVNVFKAWTGELGGLEKEINEWLRSPPATTEEVKFTNLTMIGDPMQSYAMTIVLWDKK